MELEIVVDESDGDASGGKVGVRVLGSSGDGAVIVPTTDELMAYTFQEDRYHAIQQLQQECLQKADEKVAIANQAYDMVDVVVRRLDKDLEAMEKLLQVRSRAVVAVAISYRRGELIVRQVAHTSDLLSPSQTRTVDGRLPEGGRWDRLLQGETERPGGLPGHPRRGVDSGQGAAP